jgi:MutS domain V
VSVSSTPFHSNVPVAEYKSKVQGVLVQIEALRRRRGRLLAASVACLVLFLALLIPAFNGTGLPIAVALIPLIFAIWPFRHFLRCRIRSIDLARRSAFYERGLDRMEDRWRGKGTTGLEFARDHHLYQSDLEILGAGSLFELISTTRSQAGSERLASLLLDLPTLEEAGARQAAVKELRSAVYLREDVAVLGKYQFQDCRGERLREWLDSPALKVPRILPIFLFLSGTCSLLLGLAGYAKILPLLHIAPLLLPLLLVQAGVGLAFMRRVRAHILALLAITGDVAVLRQGVALMERQQFHSAKLCALAEGLRAAGAAAAIRKLELLLNALKRREDPVLYPFALCAAAGTQLVLAVGRWRGTHQRDFEDWLDAWSEFDALNAIACYSWEHPDHVFPELVDGGARFEAEGLGHPLVRADRCVGNAIVLGESTAFYVISGSNMAGKSTLLRAIGLNAVLASAGAPVCAASACMSVFRVCASIAIQDSLQEGRSKFLAEVARLRASICAAREGQSVLFLIDEILAGTNSIDRRIAAEAVIRALVEAGAVGALSTHDLSLTEIGEYRELRGINVHMQSAIPEEPLAFDYRVKPGISRQTNALAIVRMMGISV